MAGLFLLPFSLLRRGRNERDEAVSAFLSEVRSNVRLIATSLTRIKELKSRFGLYEEELKSQLDITVSELRSLRELLEEEEIKLNGLDGDAYNAVRVIEAYSIISDSEGVTFVDENADRILRAARWCDGILTKALKSLKKPKR